MTVFDWLVNRAATPDTPKGPMPVPASREFVPSPADDTLDEQEMLEADETGTIELEEIYSIIEYIDSSGARTRRRIPLRKIQPGPKGPLLSAICHERRALRSFRCDRIQCFIDDDGVVVEPGDFFRDLLCFDPESLAPEADDLALHRARELRDLIRPGLSTLVIAAMSDEDFHASELDVICRYIEDDLETLAKRKKIEAPTISEIDAMIPLVRKMRPQATSLPSYLRKIVEYDTTRFARFCNALRELILADERISCGEAEFMSDLAILRTQGLTGVLRRIDLPETEWG